MLFSKRDADLGFKSETWITAQWLLYLLRWNLKHLRSQVHLCESINTWHHEKHSCRTVEVRAIQLKCDHLICYSTHCELQYIRAIDYLGIRNSFIRKRFVYISWRCSYTWSFRFSVNDASQTKDHSSLVLLDELNHEAEITFTKWHYFLSTILSIQTLCSHTENRASYALLDSEYSLFSKQLACNFHFRS